MHTTPAGSSGAGGEAGSTGLEPLISTVLRWGVLAAAFVILAGVALFVVEAGPGAILLAPRGIPPGAERDPSALRIVLRELWAQRHVPTAVTDLGLLLLIATPVLNVIVVAVGFARERDWMYVGIATFVLMMLIVGFALGRA
jgi:uncharacterized membrane protein